MAESKSVTRRYLIKKLLTTCPTCQKDIYGKDIDISKINTDKIDQWPLRYTHCHTHDDVPLHALTLYLDSDFSVRARETSDFIIIQQ